MGPSGYEKEGDERLTDDERAIIADYSQVWFDTETAYNLQIITLEICIMKDILSNLSWYKDEKDQQEAIEILKNIKDEMFWKDFLKNLSKDQWYNGVETIKRSNVAPVEYVIPQLLNLLKDINWPGAREACSLLKEIFKKNQTIVIKNIEFFIIKAYEEGDENWLYWLSLLSIQLLKVNCERMSINFER